MTGIMKDFRKRSAMLVSLLLLVGIYTSGQDLMTQKPFQNARQSDLITVALGGGLDYGGFGGNLTVYPVQNVGIFGGLGYALAGLGMNAGIKYRYIPGKAEARVHPFAMAMYGYNAAIYVINRTDLNKLFYGPTVGIGTDLYSRTPRRGYWSLALVVPIRKKEVSEYMDLLESDFGAEFQTRLFPVGVSVGYRLILMTR